MIDSSINYSKSNGLPTLSAISGFQPDPLVDLVEWSNTYRYLPRESSIEPGRYSTTRVPYVNEILRELSLQSPTTEVVVIKPTQFGFTEVANNFLFSIAHFYPGPCLMAMPTDEMAKKHSKKKIASSVRAMPCLTDKISMGSRKGGNTLLLKEFPGGSWVFTGSNSPTSARSDSIRYLILDDFDGFVDDMGGEGEPGDLLKKRTDAFGSRKKIYINSTPTIKGKSKIEKEFDESSQGYFHAACPHCGKYQYLIFGGSDSEFGLKFEHNDDLEIIDIYYQCEFCFSRIDEHFKTQLLESGKYIHKFPDRKKRGFKINALYSPVGWVSWSQVAEEFLHARKNPKKLQVWTNTRMAETFAFYESVREDNILSKLKDERPAGMVPSGGIVAALTAGIDTQDNGFWYEIRAWGFGQERESWQVRSGFIDSIQAIEEILWHTEYFDVDGEKYFVRLAIQDAMGHRTDEVYDFCRGHRGAILPYKGEQRLSQPFTYSQLDFFPGSKKPIPGGLQLIRSDTNYFKNVLAAKLDIAPGDPGAWHFNSETTEDWIKQLTVEFINEKGVWDCPDNAANHSWDCSHMNILAAEILNIRYQTMPEKIQVAKKQQNKKINPFTGLREGQY